MPESERRRVPFRALINKTTHSEVRYFILKMSLNTNSIIDILLQKGGDVPKKKKGVKSSPKKKNNIKKMPLVGGMPLSNGVAFFTQDFLVIGMKDEDRNLEVTSFKLAKIHKKIGFLFIPFLRGAAIMIQNLYFYLKLLWHKRKFVKRQLRKKTKFERFLLRLDSYFNQLLILLVIIGFFDYLVLRMNSGVAYGGIGFIYSIIASILIITMFLVFFAIFIFFRRVGSEMFHYHSVEHQVLNSFEKNGKGDESSIAKAEQFHYRCSAPVFGWSIVFLAFFINCFMAYNLNSFGSFVVTVLLLILSYSVAYELVRLSVFSKSRFLINIFILPFTFLQYITLKQPTHEQVLVGKKTFEKILSLEKMGK